MASLRACWYWYILRWLSTARAALLVASVRSLPGNVSRAAAKACVAAQEAGLHIVLAHNIKLLR